jgi:hypothetical protein
MISRSLFRSAIGVAFVSMLALTAGCAVSPDGEDGEEETGSAESAASGTVTGKCPTNHVCVYEHKDFNNYLKQAGWSWQFGPEDLYPGQAGRSFSRDFTKGKDKASSLINNSSFAVCLINYKWGGYKEEVIAKVGAGQKLAYVGNGANDKADKIKRC